MSDVLASVMPVTRAASPTRAGAWRTTSTLIGRGVRLSSRNIEALTMSLMLPVILMLVFVYLFGGAIATDGDYVTYVVPGVILLCAGFGSAMTATTVSQDMAGGVIDRFRSMDISGGAVLAGHIAASVARNLVSSAVVFGVAFLIGFRPNANPIEWLAAIGIVTLFILAISGLSAVAGLLARTPEGANGFTFLLMFLPYASSAFVPISTMPGWLHGFAGNQPITPVIETLRALLLGGPVADSAWRAVAWCLGILVASMLLSGVLFRRRTR